MKKSVSTVVLIFVLAFPALADAASPNALILNEANTVSGGKYLGGGKTDAALGRVQGNGQNWLEFLVARTDPGKNTLDLRGWKMEWEYNKTGLEPGELPSFGSGTMTFSQDPLWSAVPLGSAIVVNEYREAWYLTNTPDELSGNPDGDPIPGGGGMQRNGGVNGFGTQTGSDYSPGTETKLNFATDTNWNPVVSGGGPDWNINVWAGEQSAGNFKYFSYSGSVTDNGVTSTVGVDAAAGLFVANNDNWIFTIKDNLGNVIQGPIGENVVGWKGGGVNSQELVKLEAFDATQHPGTTLADYQNITIAAYRDGSSSSYGAPNAWDSETHHQDLSPMRNWFNSISPGDANLDGVVDGGDYTSWADHFQTSGRSWQSGDFSGDGIVDGGDYTIWADHYAPAAFATAVPEPSSLVLAGISAAMVVAISRRRSRRR